MYVTMYGRLFFCDINNIPIQCDVEFVVMNKDIITATKYLANVKGTK